MEAAIIMARHADSKSSVRDILAKLDRSIDQARAKRLEGENPSQHDPHTTGSSQTPGQARPLRARPLRSAEPYTENDPGGKWIGRPND